VRAEHDAAALLAGSAVADLAFRISQIALPLVVLHETGSAAATGLAAGVSGVPVLLSPWWARRARQWVSSGRRLAAVEVVEAAAIALVPAAVALGVLTSAVLVTSGLILGTAEALSGPGRAALIADVGDRIGDTTAVTLLTWQDTLRRAGMVVGPAIGALAVAAGLTHMILWAESAAVLVLGALAWPVRAADARGQEVPAAMTDAPSIRSVLARHPVVLRGWMVRGVGCFTWFAFTLGLVMLGVERGREEVYFAVGMTAYGLGSLLSSVLLVRRAQVLPPLRTAGVCWALMGAGWVIIGIAPSLPVIAVAAGSGAICVVLGNACITRVVVRGTSGPDRRAALAGQSVVVNASSAAGMLVGGPLLAVFGSRPVLAAAGLVTATAALVLGVALPAPRHTRAVG